MVARPARDSGLNFALFSGVSATGPLVVTFALPVADTPENRAKYTPLSRAGKRTKAAGN